MKFLITSLLTVIIIILVIVVLNIERNPSNAYVKIDGKTFYVDVAKTPKQQELGLDIYDKLPQDRGMIFPFSYPDYYAFWMHGMKFPIDIIYINNDKIVDIFPNLPYPKNINEQPVTVTPSEKANYVLEINAGLSQKYHFKKGDVVEISL